MQGCSPCRAVITDVVGTDTAAGFSGTNAQEVAIVNSEWTNNMSGIVLGTPRTPRSALPSATADRRQITSTTTATSPHRRSRSPIRRSGMGIVVAGGLDNRGHGEPDRGSTDLRDRRGPDPRSEPRGRPRATRSATTSFAGAGSPILRWRRPRSGGDCFAGNGSSTSEPPAIEALVPLCRLAPDPGRRWLARRHDGGTDAFPRCDGRQLRARRHWRTHGAPASAARHAGRCGGGAPTLAIPASPCPHSRTGSAARR